MTTPNDPNDHDPDLAEFEALLEASSLGRPGAKAARKLGALFLSGVHPDQAHAALTPDEHAALDHELHIQDQETDAWMKDRQ